MIYTDKGMYLLSHAKPKDLTSTKLQEGEDGCSL